MKEPTLGKFKKRILALLSLVAVIVVAVFAGRSKAYQIRKRQIEKRRRENQEAIEETDKQLESVKQEKVVALEEKSKLIAQRAAVIAEGKRLEAMEVDNAERLRRLASDPSEW